MVEGFRLIAISLFYFASFCFPYNAYGLPEPKQKALNCVVQDSGIDSPDVTSSSVSPSYYANPIQSVGTADPSPSPSDEFGGVS